MAEAEWGGIREGIEGKILEGDRRRNEVGILEEGMNNRIA